MEVLQARKEGRDIPGGGTVSTKMKMSWYSQRTVG